MKRFLITVLVLLLIVGVFFVAICYWTGSKNPDFAVLYGSSPLESLEESLACSPSEPLEFVIQGNEDYLVQVIPVADVDLSYIVSGELISLKDSADLTDCFEIDRGEKYLKIVPRGSLEQMLKIHHNVNIVHLPIVDYNQDFFTLVIKTENKEYRVNFGLYIYDVTDVKLSEGKLVF